MRRHGLIKALALWTFVALGPVPARAETAPAPSGEEAIRQTARTFVVAFDAGDAQAVADHFLPDGEFIAEDGSLYHGAGAIQQAFAAYFQENPGVRLKLDVEAVRLTAPDLAIEEGTSTIIPAGNQPITESRYQAVHLRRDGRWKLASSRSLEREPASPHEQLKQLEWLVGDWIDESPEATVAHHCRWSPDGNFLLAEFKVQVGTVVALDGVQRIGWDPIVRQMRSWVFDSAGGFAEGVWARVGDGWVVKMTGVRPDGAAASSTNSYRPTGPDRFIWTSVDRIGGGESEPDASVTIVRAPPKPRPE